MSDMRENIIEAVAKIIDPAEWDFCDPNGRKLLHGSVPRWQRAEWCKRSIGKARRIVRLIEGANP